MISFFFLWSSFSICGWTNVSLTHLAVKPKQQQQSIRPLAKNSADRLFHHHRSFSRLFLFVLILKCTHEEEEEEEDAI
jgi:hypothetical protein